MDGGQETANGNPNKQRVSPPEEETVSFEKGLSVSQGMPWVSWTSGYDVSRWYHLTLAHVPSPGNTREGRGIRGRRNYFSDGRTSPNLY